eukprot:scaffold6749_cov89-Skeletonema_marinoi.AAC.3
MKQLSYFNFDFDFDFDFVLASVLLSLSEYYLFLYPPMCPALLHLITVPRSSTYLNLFKSTLEQMSKWPEATSRPQAAIVQRGKG